VNAGAATAFAAASIPVAKSNLNQWSLYAPPALTNAHWRNQSLDALDVSEWLAVRDAENVMSPAFQ
jgi:hypothetical protein